MSPQILPQYNEKNIQKLFLKKFKKFQKNFQKIFNFFQNYNIKKTANPIRGVQNETQDFKTRTPYNIRIFFGGYRAYRVYRGLTIFSENDRF